MPGPYTHWESTKSLFRKLFVWGIVIIGGLWLLTYWWTPEKERLAQEYGISQDAVVIQAKPHGCDFQDVPLGNKHCHFEKVVDVERACPGPSCRVKQVYVSWRKVDE
jgi:hypothetical protein